MKYTVKDNQTIIDLAIQLYGTADAVERLLLLNSDLTTRNPAWDMTDSITPGTEVTYDEEGTEKLIVKELDGKIIISE